MHLWRDLRFAARLLVKEKWFSLAAVVALGLGIGVNTAVFTLVNAILLRDLPFEDAEEIVWVSTRDGEGRDLFMSQPDFEDLEDTAQSFEGLGLWLGGTFNLSDEETAAERYQGPYISANAFDVVGVQPVIGRSFEAEDDEADAPAVVMLGYPIWTGRYGSDPSVVGRNIRLNGFEATVVGVMPEGMQFPLNSDIWVPASQMAAALRNENRNVRGTPVFGRLADGVSLEQANAELATISARFAAAYPDTNEDITMTAVPYTERLLGSQIQLIFWSLMGAVGFVLLIACANVANLLLARSARRAREVSVRAALGASRWRIVRQLLIESVLLASLGGVLGLGLAILGIQFAELAFAEVGIPYWMAFTLDLEVFAFLAAICLVTGVLFGLAPALHVTKTDVNEVLKEGGRGGTAGRRARRWASVLVMAELALTLALLGGAGYMMRSFMVLYQLDLGIETERLVTAQLMLPDRKYPTAEARSVFFEQAEERLRENPTVEAVTFTTNAPLAGGGARQLTIEGQTLAADETGPEVTALAIGEQYFDTLGLPLVRGRPFNRRDGEEGYESAIVNQRFVSIHFPTEDPIGRRIRLDTEGPNDEEPTWLTIVGIAPTLRQRNLEEPEPDPVVYLPHRTYTQFGHMMILRGRAGAGELAPVIREQLRAVDADQPIFNINTMDVFLAQTRWPFRIFGSMFAIFAFIALVLSAVGLYSVTAYSVNQRTQELGIRMALGAQPGAVWWLLIRRTAIQVAIGLAVGMAAAAAVGQLLQSFLVQIGPNDPLTLVSIGLMLGTVAAAACIWPSLRATRLDPVDALRYE